MTMYENITLDNLIIGAKLTVIIMVVCVLQDLYEEYKETIKEKVNWLKKIIERKHTVV